MTWRNEGLAVLGRELVPCSRILADATSSMQNIAAGPPSQGYNPYSQGPVYTSASGGTGHPSAADYGSVYGSSYGY
ncbi:hypothetical protein RND71_013931 [Anisodus tanguticus]|uniref:Uncharacterized protein n=1 Tax=Anisodus tanguticus TaxID=243964 RepID=A0AAE1SBQ6_9SOLA|nr:hypothetical protein RND71_013931 [Anisodus tanguticus]